MLLVFLQLIAVGCVFILWKRFRNKSKKLPPVALTGYDALKKAYHDSNFNYRSESKFLLDRTFGKCLGMTGAKDETWHKGRTYTLKTLREYGFGKKHTLESVLQEEYEAFTKTVDITAKNNNGLIPITNLFSGPFTNMIWSMIAGYRFDYEDPKFKGLVHCSRTWLTSLSSGAGLLTAFPFTADWFPKFSGFAYLQQTDRDFQNYFFHLINEIRSIGKYKENPQTYIDSFLRDIDRYENDPTAKPFFTDENLISILMDFFIAGSDTSSMLMIFSILYMIRFPEVQEKLRLEIDEVIGTDRWPTAEDKEKMIYMNAVTMEIFRIANIVPLVPRMVQKDVEFENFLIPKGVDVLFSLYSVHMDENYWGDPHHFRPSRFLGPNGTFLHTDHLVPFSWGKKNCFGESVGRLQYFLFFTRLMQQYTFEGDPAQNGAVITDPLPGITQAPHPCNILFKPRVNV